jgi:hypothetical protein
MLYFAHFSFAFTSKARREKPQPWHGHFTALAEAADIQGALKKLEALVVETAQTSQLLGDVSEIFLESCVELKSVPRAGFVVHLAIEEGESVASISTTLPVVNRKYATAYHLAPDAVEGHDEFEPEPFVVVKRTGTAKKRASRKSR